MAKKVRTFEQDHGFKGILKELRKLEKKPFVKIGFPAENKKKDANKISSTDDGSFEVSEFITVLDVAVFHEFGTVNLPERSFLRASFDKNRKKYEKQNKKLLIKIYSAKMSVEQALAILGQMILNDIKDFLVSGEVSPKSLRAIADSGSTLVDTAQMLNSLTFRVVMNGRKK